MNNNTSSLLAIQEFYTAKTLLRFPNIEFDLGSTNNVQKVTSSLNQSYTYSPHYEQINIY